MSCLLLMATTAMATKGDNVRVAKAGSNGKTVYIPNEWKYFNSNDTLLYKETDPNNQYTWSKSRSIEGDNVIIFWDKGYGSTRPDRLSTSSNYYVDIEDLLTKCEAFYELEINQLGFVDPNTSNLSRYKVMVLMNYSNDWICYGGGYDFEVPALWLSPLTCKPVGHSVAHEVGHSFHYMCFAEHSNHQDSTTDNTGFHLACGNGQAIWEQTAQWQACQSYPGEMFSQSIGVFRNSHNYAFSHEWHRYQSYWFHYYLCQYYNDITTVAQVWNQPMTGQSQGNATDFNQALMALKGLNATGLFRLYYDYAARCATWDLDSCAPYRDSYIGDFNYRCVLTGNSSYQVALASTPQSSGFNVIPLQVPAAGTTVTTHFTALPSGADLAAGDPVQMLNGSSVFESLDRTTYISNSNAANRAFRLGYVALMSDGTRQYFNEDKLYCTGNGTATEDVTMTVPEGVSRLWLIVSPAPTTYVEHRWTDNIENAEQWPYRFQLEGTDIGPSAIVYAEGTLDGREISDVTLTYDVRFPQDASGYTGYSVTVSGSSLASLCTAFQLKADQISGKMVAYSSSGPSNNQIMFYALTPGTLALAASGSTANGYGHWFGVNGNVISYGDNSYVYSEFDAGTLTFNLGQFPGRSSNNDSYTIGQALRYKDSSGKEAIARFIFNITIDNSQTGATLTELDVNLPTVTVSESATEAPALKNSVDVQLTRTLTANKWNTLCLPCTLTAQQVTTVFGSDVVLKQFGSQEEGTLYFTDATTIEAGKPYLLKPSTTITNPTFKNVDITVTDGMAVDGADGYAFVGQLYQKSLPTDGTVAYLTADGQVKKLTSGGIKGLRAYFKIPANATQVRVSLGDNDETAISTLSTQRPTLNTQQWFDLSGRRIVRPSKGISISNGKKVVR